MKKTRTLTLADRARGVMLGMACGDALGAQVEFRTRGSFRTPRDMRDGGPHRLLAGQWTDDTSMALCLAEHLTADVRTSRGEIADLMGRWTRWYKVGENSVTGRCFDIGGRTRAALEHWMREGTPMSPDERRPYAEGNGAVMRVAPVALRWLRDEEMCGSTASRQARLTHGRIAACAAVLTAEAVRLLLLGQDSSEVAEAVVSHSAFPLSGMRDPRRLTSLDDVESGGHCLDTLEASLRCLLFTSSAEEAIVAAVALGHDADTTACVTGAMAGALYGASALPARWTSRVAWREELTETADRLIAAADGIQPKKRRRK